MGGFSHGKALGQGWMSSTSMVTNGPLKCLKPYLIKPTPHRDASPTCCTNVTNATNLREAIVHSQMPPPPLACQTHIVILSVQIPMQYNKHNLTPTNHSKINPKHSDLPPSSAALQPSLQPPPNISITWPNSRQIRKKKKKIRRPHPIQNQINQHT